MERASVALKHKSEHTSEKKKGGLMGYRPRRANGKKGVAKVGSQTSKTTPGSTNFPPRTGEGRSRESFKKNKKKQDSRNRQE